MNPYLSDAEPNYWLSCMTIDKEAMLKEVRTELTATYKKEKGKTCPAEILEKIASINAEGRPIWKPMHMQPIYKNCAFVKIKDQPVNEDVFERGLCLPSDNKMTREEQNKVIEIIKSCF